MQELFKLDERWRVHELEVLGGNKLRYAVRMPKKAIDGLFVFIGGRMEFIEKYDYFAKDLQEAPEAQSLLFLTWDHRGQGKSSGHLYHIEHFQTFVSDAVKIIEAARKEYKVKSDTYWLMGHSMGALVSIVGILRGALRPKKVLLSSPFLGFPPGMGLTPKTRKVLFNAVNRMGKLKERFPIKRSGFDWANNRLTFDPHRYQRIIRSPFGEAEPTFAWIQAVDQAFVEAHNETLLSKWRIPTFILIAEDERVVHPSAAIAWFETLMEISDCDARYEAIPHSRHELLSERPETYAKVLTFVKNFFFKK